MYHFPSAPARQLLAALSAGLILTLSSNVASSAENCERLEALAVQYAGVELTRGAEATQAENDDLVLDALHSSRGSLSLAGLETPSAREINRIMPIMIAAWLGGDAAG